MVLLTEIPSSTTNDYQFDVFLSFRGVDTRLTFISHLYEALVDADLTTFLDDEAIDTGEPLKPELQSAIESSRASIIVLSENYASSTWCLDELVLILEQNSNCKQIVIPIFYGVEPTHVRKQQRSFAEAMANHKQKMEAETDAEKRCQLAQKMELWKKALTDVADLKGKDVKGRKETDLIEEVVTEIHSRLGAPLSNTIPLIIGMKYEIEFIGSWLTDGSCQTTDILTIVGMGGIGKTSLAKYVFRLHSHKFEKSSFIEGISTRCNERFSGLLDLQKQLHEDISKKLPLLVNDVSVYTSKIENALARKRVFIVLDDIDSLDQLDALLGNIGLHPGSKIIITTKDASLTERCALFESQVQPKHKEVSLTGLYESESLKLLCIHAFKSNTPKEGYKEVSKKLVKHCDGHPLVLEVLGRSLHKRDVAYWEDCIKGLMKEPHSCIKKALKMSIDSLPFKNDMDLFKYIACFFVGTDRDVTETILKACNINTRSGITNLIDRCLLSIGCKNRLVMHQLVQEMGRHLVRQESPDKPWERSRLWNHEESFEVLKQKKGAENLLGLVLDMRMLEKEKLSGSIQLEADAFNKMDNLKLLQLNYVKINGSYKNMSKELRWLCMHGLHFKDIPLELPMENLVVLDMSHSNIESFDISYSSSQRLVNRLKVLTGSSSKDKRLLGSLKILDLSFCEQLSNLGGFFELPALERLIISNCTSLIQVSESIEYCVELLFIDLSNCKKLKKLPRTIGMLKKVKTILSNGCDLSIFPIETRGMDSLQKLKADNIEINLQTSSSANVEVIPRDLRSFISCMPISLAHLSLKNNNLSNKSFPMDFSSLSALKELYLDGNPIVSMPSCVRNLPRLEKLTMVSCSMLETIEHPPSSLRELQLGILFKLKKIRFNPEMSPLRLMSFNKYHFLVIEGIIKVQPMAHVEDEVLCSLGWAKSELVKYQHFTTPNQLKKKRYRIQMYYEFGIFSTFYAGKEMPNWISCRSMGTSISFTIPSSPNKLRGLNICYGLENLSYLYKQYEIPMIVVSNITKNSTWIYDHFLFHVWLAEEYLIFLSHWMFGKNEMEDGDEVTIFIAIKHLDTDYVCSIRECGVGLVYDNGRMKDDVLGYYKSWNHIIGGDLSAFQTTTGEYILFHNFFLHVEFEIFSRFQPFVARSAHPKGERIRFRAFSQQKSELVVHQRESTRGVLETMHMIESLRTQISIVEFIYNIFKCSKVKTRSHLCFSLKLYTISRYLQYRANYRQGCNSLLESNQSTTNVYKETRCNRDKTEYKNTRRPDSL